MNDTTKLVDISKDYLPADKLKELLCKLCLAADDSNLKQTFTEMQALLEPPVPSKWWTVSLYLLIVVHYCLVLGIVSSFFVLPFLASWYVALPLMVFIWFFSTSKVECKLTQLENYIRRKLGMKQIGGFVSHYFKKPAKRMWSKLVLTKLN